MTNYVYQFVLEPKNNGQFGLIFSEESEVYQSPVFAISTRTELIHDTYSFPGELGGEYTEFKLTFRRESFLLKDGRLEYNLKFQIFPFLNDEYYYQIRNLKMKFPYYPYFSYIGRHKALFNKEEEFQIIVPTDLMLMDKLYLENKFCLVGYTPTFNNDQRESV